MSPTRTEPDEIDRHELGRDEVHDAELRRDEEGRRGFFQKHPAAKPVAFLIAIVAVLLIGWFWWESRQWQDTDDAQVDGHIYPISARVGGQITKVNFDDGQMVHKGDV